MKTLSARLEACGVSSDSIEKLIALGGTSVVEENLDSLWTYWSRLVDESDYGWSEWVAAVLLLHGRILASEANRKEPELRGLIGYVGCTAAGPGGVAFGETLTERVAEAFDEYGYLEEG